VGASSRAPLASERQSPWLTPEDMTVDERRKTVFVIIKLEIIDRKTGEVLVKERGATQYQLVLDQNDHLKVKSFVFFPQRVAPGIQTGTDAFMKDWQASQSG
jgi:hypothetical protein